MNLGFNTRVGLDDIREGLRLYKEHNFDMVEADADIKAYYLFKYQKNKNKTLALMRIIRQTIEANKQFIKKLADGGVTETDFVICCYLIRTFPFLKTVLEEMNFSEDDGEIRARVVRERMNLGVTKLSLANAVSNAMYIFTEAGILKRLGKGIYKYSDETKIDDWERKAVIFTFMGDGNLTNITEIVKGRYFGHIDIILKGEFMRENKEYQSILSGSDFVVFSRGF